MSRTPTGIQPPTAQSSPAAHRFRASGELSSAFAMPIQPAFVRDALKAHDVVRLTGELNGTPSGTEGIVLGWYANQPEFVIVRLNEGGVQNVPRSAVELVEPEPERASA